MQLNKRYARPSHPSKVRKRLDSVRQVGDEKTTANSEDHTQATGDLLSSAEGSYSQARNYLLDPQKTKAMTRKIYVTTARERRTSQYFPPSIHPLSGGLI